MFRRRASARRMFGPRPPLPMAERPRQLLRQAHLLFDKGDYPAAAQSFFHLAEEAQIRGLLRHAPFLFLQAGRAYLAAGQIAQALTCFQKGLGLLAQTGRWPAFERAKEEMIIALNACGQADAANKLQMWLQETFTQRPQRSAQPTYASHRPALPAKCPYCGATLRSDEVEWIDERSAECAYCGSAVQSEE